MATQLAPREYRHAMRELDLAGRNRHLAGMRRRPNTRRQLDRDLTELSRRSP